MCDVGMRKRSIFILICWIILGFFLYIGYAENFDLPILNLPPAYSYLPALLQTQESTIVFLITGLVLGIASILCGFIMFFSLFGLIFGILAIIFFFKQRKIWPNGISLAGLITGCVGTFFSLIGLLRLVLFIVMFALYI